MNDMSFKEVSDMIEKLFTNHPKTHQQQTMNHKANTGTHGHDAMFRDTLQEVHQTIIQSIQAIDLTEQLHRKNILKNSVQKQPIIETDEKIFDRMDEDLTFKTEGLDDLLVPLVDDFQQKTNPELALEWLTDMNPSLTMPLKQQIPITYVQQVTVDNHMPESQNHVIYHVIEKIEQLLKRPNDKQLMKETVVRFQEWLAKGEVHSDQKILSETIDTEALDIWDKLVKRVKQRNHQLITKGYGVESRITISEISRWLTSFLSHNLDNNEEYKVDTFDPNLGESHKVMRHKSSIEQPIQPLPTIPMSNVEQYIVHVNHSSKQHNGGEITKQLEKIIQVSQFMTKPGQTQLSISFRPEQLGEMMLRFSQINDETVVKIVVTTQVAQKALEANINQLKHLFMPHQVVIERQDLTINQGVDMNQDAEDFEQNDHEQQHNQSKDRREKSNHHFEKELEQFLNEKV